MAKIVNCPQCGTQTEYSKDNSSRPFCSERCRLTDLGAWAEESYKMPTADGTSSSEYDDYEEQLPPQKPDLH